MSSKSVNMPETGLRKLYFTGAAGLLALVGVFGFWAVTTTISGAVVASGQVDVSGKPKTVQSLDGGILSEIAVQDGDVVQAGDVLARLDPTLLQINLDIARSRLAAALSQRSRLEAERAGFEAITFDYSDLPEAVQVVHLDTTKGEEGQRAIFEARVEMLKGGRDRLAGSLQDIDTQVMGTTGQISALEDQLDYLQGDLENLTGLVNKGLARADRLSEKQSTQASLLGDLAGRRADLARLNNSRREAELETLQQERSFHEQVVTDLRTVTAEIEELVLQIVTHRAQLERVDIRAPTGGIIHELQLTTLGGVIAPGGTLLDIVPQHSGFDFEVRVEPQSINRLGPDQTAQIVLSAFDPQTTPKLEARVRSISPETVQDQQTGQAFYRVSLEVPLSELARLPQGADLIPGMPVEAYLQTNDRTVLSYLVEPMNAHLRRAFRE